MPRSRPARPAFAPHHGDVVSHAGITHTVEWTGFDDDGVRVAEIKPAHHSGPAFTVPASELAPASIAAAAA